jgi:hypothetical protein
METIRTTAQVENGHVTVDVPAHWRNQEVEVEIVAKTQGDSKTGNGAHVMAIAEAIVAKGGVTWPMNVMEWQRVERQDRPLPERE